MGEHYEPTVGEPMAFYGTTDPQPVPTMQIAPGGKLLVKLWPDGTLEYGEEYEPDETARYFWEQMAVYFPGHQEDLRVAKLLEALRLTVEHVGLDTLSPIEGWSWYDAWKEVDPEGLEAWLDHMQLDL